MACDDECVGDCVGVCGHSLCKGHKHHNTHTQRNQIKDLNRPSHDSHCRMEPIHLLGKQPCFYQHEYCQVALAS